LLDGFRLRFGAEDALGAGELGLTPLVPAWPAV
jgi:hypothetical protein